MQLKDLIDFVRIASTSATIWFVIPALLTLIQITPIKINPWDTLLQWLGRKFVGELCGELERLERQIEQVQKDTEERIVTDMRWHILNFARRCRMNEHHTKEQWNHVLSQAKKYEIYITEHKLENGVIEEDTKYIRELYNKLSKEGKIK